MPGQDCRVAGADDPNQKIRKRLIIDDYGADNIDSNIDGMKIGDSLSKGSDVSSGPCVREDDSFDAVVWQEFMEYCVDEFSTEGVLAVSDGRKEGLAIRRCCLHEVDAWEYGGEAVPEMGCVAISKKQVVGPVR